MKDENLTRSTLEEVCPSSTVQLVKKQFNCRYVVSSADFTSEMVGAKSRNIAYLKGKVPSFVGIPTSVALPFGVFKKVLSNELNQGLSEKLQILKKQLEADGSEPTLHPKGPFLRHHPEGRKY